MAEQPPPGQAAQPPATGPFVGSGPAAIPYRRPPASGAADPPPRAPAPPAMAGRPAPAGVGRSSARLRHAARSAAHPVALLALVLAIAVGAGTSVVIARSGAVSHLSTPPRSPSAPTGASPTAASNAPPARSGPWETSPPRARRSTPPSAKPPGPPAKATLAVTLRVRGDARVLRVRATDLGSQLLRVVRLDNGRVRARLVDDRTADLQLFPQDGSAPTVEVLVDSAVRWSVRTEGRVDQTDIDLSRATVGRIELRGGAAIRLALPAPAGALPVRIDGGAPRCDVTTPRDVPARILVRRGAGHVVVDERELRAARAFSIGTAGRSGIVDFQADRLASLTWTRHGNS